MGFEDIDQRIVEAFAIGEDGGHKLGGVIELEPGGLIGFNAVSSAVGFTESIAFEAGDEFPNFGDFAFSVSASAGAVGEFDLDFSDEVGFAFGEGATEDVSAARRQAGESIANLEDVLLIDNQTVSAVEAGFERGMGIVGWSKLLIAASELHLFVFVGCAGANDGNDSNEGINVPDIAHLAERNHSRAFDVMNGAGLAAGDKFPDAGVVPRFEGVEVNGGRRGKAEGRPKSEIRNFTIG